jgi:hypothetical protein
MAQSSPPANQFTPKVGEPVKIWHHAIKPGQMEQAKTFFLGTLVPRLKGDNILLDVFFVVNEKGNEILAINFWGQADVAKHPHGNAVDDGMKAHAAKTRQLTDYKLALINDEGLLPQIGDLVVIMTRKVKPGKMEEAKRVMKEVIFAHLAKDEFSRNSYVLENAAGNELVSLIFLRGEFKVPVELLEKRDKHLKPHLAEPEKKTEYKLFAISNE